MLFYLDKTPSLRGVAAIWAQQRYWRMRAGPVDLILITEGGNPTAPTLPTRSKASVFTLFISVYTPPQSLTSIDIWKKNPAGHINITRLYPLLYFTTFTCVLPPTCHAFQPLVWGEIMLLSIFLRTINYWLEEMKWIRIERRSGRVSLSASRQTTDGGFVAISSKINAITPPIGLFENNVQCGTFAHQ